MRTRLQSKNQNVSEDRWVVDVNNLNMDGDFCRIGWINTYALFWFIALLLFDTAWWFPGAIINGQSWYKCVLYSASTFMCNDCWCLNIQASTTVKVIVKDHFQKLCDSQIWYTAAVPYSDGLLLIRNYPTVLQVGRSLYIVYPSRVVESTAGTGKVVVVINKNTKEAPNKFLFTIIYLSFLPVFM